MGIGEAIVGLRIQKWNALVGRMTLVKETDAHYHFVHPTKGKRKISKKRLEAI